MQEIASMNVEQENARFYYKEDWILFNERAFIVSLGVKSHQMFGHFLNKAPLQGSSEI